MKFFSISITALVILIPLYIYFESPSVITSDDSPEAHLKLGKEYLKKNTPQSIEKAIGEFKAALRQKPDYAEAYLNLGKAYHERHITLPGGYDHPKEETEAYRKAIELRPDYAEAYVSLGDTVLPHSQTPSAEESFKQATALYAKALQVDPNCGAAYEGLTVIYLHQQRFAEAENATKQALLLNPESRRSWFIIHDSCWIGRRCEEAIRICEDINQAKPDNVIGLHVTARIYYKLGRFQDSVNTYRRMIELAPKNVEAHYELGSTYIATGDKQAALDEYNSLRSIDYKSAKKLLDKINSGTISLLD